MLVRKNLLILNNARKKCHLSLEIMQQRSNFVKNKKILIRISCMREGEGNSCLVTHGNGSVCHRPLHRIIPHTHECRHCFSLISRLLFHVEINNRKLIYCQHLRDTKRQTDELPATRRIILRFNSILREK